MKRRTRILAAVVVLCWPIALSAQELALPKKSGSVRFAVLGDVGTGDRAQNEVANILASYRLKFPFTFALLLGDNIYGSERPQDFSRKFEIPYKSLLDAKVEFHATLGNHDDQNQRYYKPFNLGGERYRTFQKGNVRFYVIDSNYLDPDQVKWLEKELAASGTAWKIPYFHHPLYTTARRGPEIELRAILEPLFVKYGVDVVFQGHEHLYERIKPQKGVYYFTNGGAAKLTPGGTRAGTLVEVGYAADRSFMLVEVSGNELYFQTINRAGVTVDKGVIRRREVRPATAARPAPPRRATPKPLAKAPAKTPAQSAAELTLALLTLRPSR